MQLEKTCATWSATVQESTRDMAMALLETGPNKALIGGQFRFHLTSILKRGMIENQKIRYRMTSEVETTGRRGQTLRMMRCGPSKPGGLGQAAGADQRGAAVQ